MLRLLTLRKYLPVMTVQEQERIFRDGQPFTLAEIEVQAPVPQDMLVFGYFR